jgi:hypothetical protein
VTGKAIDMNVSWGGTINVARMDGTKTAMAAPRNGSNPALRQIGKSYGVIKHQTDPPHWSVDGR